MNDTSLPLGSGTASDLPGQPVTGAATTPWRTADPIVEHVPEHTAARGLLVVALGGFIAQLLFFEQAPGLNVLLWIGFVLSAALVVRRHGARIDRYDMWLPAGAIVFAALCAWRADAMLLAFDLLAAGCLTLASVVATGGQPLTRSSGRVVTQLGARAAALYLVGAANLARGFRHFAPLARQRDTTTWRIARGLALALPIVLVFVVLFAAADAVFDVLLRNVFRFELDSDALFGRGLLALLAAWLLGGTLVAGFVLHSRTQEDADSGAEHRPLLGSVEVTVFLVALDLVFVAFVALQAAYLFGGLDTLAISGLTYSEYARRGFGELVVAALLAGVVLVVLAHIADTGARAFRFLAAILCAATGVIVVSALMRIGLYQEAYGWTELRFYTVAGIAWLALCVAAALIAVAARRVTMLPAFALASGLFVAVLCNAIGPQSFVTEQNVLRAAHPELVAPGGESGFDVDYPFALDADAVRVLVATVDTLPPDVQVAARDGLSAVRRNLEDVAGHGWASWNYARSAALDALIANGY